MQARPHFQERLARILKPESLHDDPALLESYSGDRSFVPKGRPVLVVYPESRAEVRESMYREPHSWALLEMFKIKYDRIVAVEATFIGVPYNMSSPWSDALDP